MDYITRRDVTKAYVRCVWSTTNSHFPRLTSAGPRVIRAGGDWVNDRQRQESSRFVVPRREVEQALIDLELTEIIGPLPLGDPLDAGGVEALFAKAGLEPTALRAQAEAFLDQLANDSTGREIT
jgi:hypothetical protein